LTPPTDCIRTLLLAWPDEAACAASAAALGAAIVAAGPGPHDAYIELTGDLGAGKTTFVRHLLHALGVVGRVKSPTYAVVEGYEVPLADGTPQSIWHFDFYRFDDPQEWEDAGFREMFSAPAIKLAEWPDKAHGLLPLPDLRIAIETDPEIGIGTPTGEPRSARFEARSPLGARLLPR
jgi:tRNA threonylcarbamoyladenosine biosynthesis protein TsaE